MCIRDSIQSYISTYFYCETIHNFCGYVTLCTRYSSGIITQRTGTVSTFRDAPYGLWSVIIHPGDFCLLCTACYEYRFQIRSESSVRFPPISPPTGHTGLHIFITLLLQTQNTIKKVNSILKILINYNKILLTQNTNYYY